MHRMALILMALAGTVFGQTYDHLEPDDSIFRYGWSLDYYSNVARVLGSVLPEQSPKVFVLPSNLNEYVIGINEEGARCAIVVGRVEHTLWLYESRKDNPDLDRYMSESNFPEVPFDVGVDVRAQPVSWELCDRILNVWATVLLRTRYPDPDERRLGVDGVSFHFSVWLRKLLNLT